MVKSKTVSSVLSAIIGSLADQLSNPKLAFTNWLGRLEAMPGFAFKVPTSMKLLIDGIAKEKFRVMPKVIRTELHTKSKTGTKFVAELKSDKLLYATILKEAEKRKGTLGMLPP